MKDIIIDFVSFLFNYSFLEGNPYPKDLSDISILDEETFTFSLEEISIDFLVPFMQYIEKKGFYFHISAEEDSCLIVVKKLISDK